MGDGQHSASRSFAHIRWLPPARHGRCRRRPRRQLRELVHGLSPALPGRPAPPGGARLARRATPAMRASSDTRGFADGSAPAATPAGCSVGCAGAAGIGAWASDRFGTKAAGNAAEAHAAAPAVRSGARGFALNARSHCAPVAGGTVSLTVHGVLPAPSIIAATVWCRPPFLGTHPAAAVAGVRMQARVGSSGQSQAVSGEAWATV
jgi:hypothetical protein